MVHTLDMLDAEKQKMVNIHECETAAATISLSDLLDYELLNYNANSLSCAALNTSYEPSATDSVYVKL